MLKSIICGTMLFVFSLQPRYSMSKRPCRNNTLSIHKADVNTSHAWRLAGTIDDIKLVLHVNWTIGGIEDDDFDGFLVRLKNPGGQSISPAAGDCQASSTHVWVTTNNESLCDVSNHTTSYCNHMTQKEVSCKCERSSCLLLDESICSGTASRLKLRYHSLPKTRRSIVYDVLFNDHYSFELLPYYRKWHVSSFRKVVTIPSNFDCAEMVATEYGITFEDAIEKCCRSNISSLLPTNLTIGELTPDYSTMTLNLSITWLLPMRLEVLKGIYLHMGQQDRLDNEFLPKYTNYEPSLPEAANSSCSKSSTSHTQTAYNLLPNKEYTLTLQPWYPRPLCSGSSCKVQIKYRTDFNSCDAKWNRCTAETICTILNETDGNGPQMIPKTNCSLPSDCTPCADTAQCIEKDGSASCACRTGLYGDGIKKLYNGTECAGCSGQNICDELAECIATDSTSYSYKCQCDEYHYGDGMKLGSGCTSRAKWIATIVVPIVFLVIIIIIVICWVVITRPSKAKHTAGQEANPLPL